MAQKFYKAGLLSDTGLKAVEVHTESKLKSPRQIELLLSVDMRFMLDPAEPDSLVERPEGEPQLVRADASRAIAPPATGFTPIAAKAETKVKSD